MAFPPPRQYKFFPALSKRERKQAPFSLHFLLYPVGHSPLAAQNHRPKLAFNRRKAERPPMLPLALERGLFRLELNTPALPPLFQLPPRIRHRKWPVPKEKQLLFHAGNILAQQAADFCIVPCPCFVLVHFQSFTLSGRSVLSNSITHTSGFAFQPSV